MSPTNDSATVTLGYDGPYAITTKVNPKYSDSNLCIILDIWLTHVQNSQS